MPSAGNVFVEADNSERRAFFTTGTAAFLALAAVSLLTGNVVRVLMGRERRWNRSLLPLAPWDYARRADSALARGDKDLAVALIERAYLACDLCSRRCVDPDD